MDGEIRSIPGDRLVSRILTRVRRRPRLGMSPDFFARFGMSDPWSAPEFAGEESAGGEGMVFLSAQPYYAMMRRLAASRRRRERREAAFQARHSGARIQAVARHWPGETAASLAVSRIARLALDEMTLPPVIAPAAAPVVASQAGPVAAAPARRGSTAFTQRGANAWWSTPFVPARVFGAAPAGEAPVAEDRPLAEPARALSTRATSAPARRPSSAAHAGARLAAATVGDSPAARALAEALPAAVGVRRRQLATIVEAIETLPPEEREVQIRRVVRRLGASAPIVRSVIEEGPSDSVRPAARPAQVASRRADPVPSAGLRPVLSRSPAMALAAAPEVDRAASGTLATAERSAEQSGSSASLGRLPRRAASAQRALARGAAAPVGGASSVPAPLSYARAVTTQALSASPVLRAAPAAAAPRGAAPRASVRAASAPPAPLYFGEALAPVAGPAVRTRRPASARAVARLAASPVETPIFERAEAAQGAVRTTEGTWAAARDVAPSRRDPSAPRASVRSAPASAHAASRVEAGQVEGRSVLPRAIPASPDRVLAALPAAPVVAAALSASPVARPARPPAAEARHADVAPSGSMPVRTAEGAWVPARSPAGRAAVEAAATRSVAERAAVRSPLRTESAPAQAPRLGAADRLATGPLRSEPSGSSPRPSIAGTLAPSAFRTAEPVAAASAPAAAAASSSSSASAARPSRVIAPAAIPATAARATGVVHAASRAAPASDGSGRPALAERVASTRLDAPSRADAPARSVASPAQADAPAAGRSAERTVRATRAEAVRASIVRVPAMAHASARTDLPAEGATLQPRVSPVAERAQPAGRRIVAGPKPSRVATVAAAARVLAAPLFSATGARVFAEGADATTPSAPSAPARSRFSRSGPLSFALPPLSAAVPAAPSAGADLPASRATTRSRVRAAQVYTTPSSAYSPSSAVTTPSGVWISARTAAATPGLRILRTEAGRLVAIAPAPPASSVSSRIGGAAPGAPSAPARASATAAATFARPYVPPVDDAADALIAPPAAVRHRASAWAANRTRVGEATAYRGAYRTPDVAGVGARVFTTPEGEPTAAAEPTTSRTPARRDRPRRVSAMAGEMSLPTPQIAATPGAVSPAGGGVASRAGRAPLDERLHGVAVGSPDTASPSWAARSDGAPRVRSPGGLFEALARATSTEEIVRVIYARADGVRETPLAREAPVVQVVEQIRQEVRREQAAAEAGTRASRLDAPSATTIRGTYVQPVQSTTRVNRGGVRAVGATARSVSAGSGDDRVMKLVKKLQGLIHLAEAEGRLADARAQVRMAEDSASARAEGQGPVGTSKEGGEKGQKQDIDALGREVLEVVTRELEFRRSRRVEDHDESSWW